MKNKSRPHSTFVGPPELLKTFKIAGQHDNGGGVYLLKSPAVSSTYDDNFGTICSLEIPEAFFVREFFSAEVIGMLAESDEEFGLGFGDEPYIGPFENKDQVYGALTALEADISDDFEIK